MINKLVIKNIALIESAEIEFDKGLNVLSGETGSGKSVILDSLNFVLGAKADKSLIRSGQAECFVCAEFDVSGIEAVKAVYDEFEFDYDDILIISRKYTADGKNSVKINGNSANVGMLKRFTEILVDIHGQSEHFALLSNLNQLKLIDKFGGEEIRKIKESLKSDYTEYKNILSELQSLGGDESQRLFKLDILNFQIKEIEELNLKDGEEQELKIIRDKLLNQEKIVSSLNSVKSAIGDEGGTYDSLSGAVKSLSLISALSNDYSSLFERLNSVYAEIDDIIDSVDSLIDDFDYSEYNLDEIESRLEKIKNAKKKYGDDFLSIYNFLENAKQEKDRLENFNVLAEKLLKDKNILENKLYESYLKLSDARKRASKIFSDSVVEELKELGMTKASFVVNFNEIDSRENCKFDSANGIDNLEFFFSANFGEPVKPLSFVISGGEISRFMLAIKAQSAKYNEISTFVFDEIDAGISGVIALVVAKKLFKISNSVQVISISHLPQIVSFADNNILIQKSESDDKTVTSVKRLNAEEKIGELIRLVGGNSDSKSAKELAKDLIDYANNYKSLKE